MIRLNMVCVLRRPKGDPPRMIRCCGDTMVTTKESDLLMKLSGRTMMTKGKKFHQPRFRVDPVNILFSVRLKLDEGDVQKH